MSLPPSLRRRRSSERGAVMVESLIAIPTILALFFMTQQLAYLAVAQLVTQHAAVQAARAAIVIVPDDPFAFDDRSPIGSAKGDRLAAVKLAAQTPLAAVSDGKAPRDVQVEVQLLKDGQEAEEFEKDDVVGVSVHYDYECTVPVGKLICGADATAKLEATASMPNQGAEYGYY